AELCRDGGDRGLRAARVPAARSDQGVRRASTDRPRARPAPRDRHRIRCTSRCCHAVGIERHERRTRRRRGTQTPVGQGHTVSAGALAGTPAAHARGARWLTAGGLVLALGMFLTLATIAAITGVALQESAGGEAGEDPVLSDFARRDIPGRYL